MALESEVEVLKSVVSKLDTSIEKISQVANDIGKLLAVHDARIDILEKVADKRNDDIKELHSRITTGNRELMDKMDDLESKIEDRMRAGAEAATKQHNDIKDEVTAEIRSLEQRIDVLERWKWLVIGASAAIGYVAANFSVFTKIFG